MIIARRCTKCSNTKQMKTIRMDLIRHVIIISNIRLDQDVLLVWQEVEFVITVPLLIQLNVFSEIPRLQFAKHRYRLTNNIEKDKKLSKIQINL